MPPRGHPEFMLRLTGSHEVLRSWKNLRDDLRKWQKGQPGWVDVDEAPSGGVMEGWTRFEDEENARKAYSRYCEPSMKLVVYLYRTPRGGGQQLLECNRPGGTHSEAPMGLTNQQGTYQYSGEILVPKPAGHSGQMNPALQGGLGYLPTPSLQPEFAQQNSQMYAQIYAQQHAQQYDQQHAQQYGQQSAQQYGQNSGQRYAGQSTGNFDPQYATELAHTFGQHYTQNINQQYPPKYVAPSDQSCSTPGHVMTPSGLVNVSKGVVPTQHCGVIFKNLEEHTTINELDTFVKKIAQEQPVQGFNMPMEPSGTKNKGSATAVFKNPQIAQRVVNACNKQLLKGKVLDISFDRNQERAGGSVIVHGS